MSKSGHRQRVSGSGSVQREQPNAERIEIGDGQGPGRPANPAPNHGPDRRKCCFGPWTILIEVQRHQEVTGKPILTMVSSSYLKRFLYRAWRHRIAGGHIITFFIRHCLHTGLRDRLVCFGPQRAFFRKASAVREGRTSRRFRSGMKEHRCANERKRIVDRLGRSQTRPSISAADLNRCPVLPASLGLGHICALGDAEQGIRPSIHPPHR